MNNSEVLRKRHFLVRAIISCKEHEKLRMFYFASELERLHRDYPQVIGVNDYVSELVGRE